MRSFKRIRFVVGITLVLALLLSAVALVSAQEVTPEATDDMMMSHMAMMDGACPEGMAGTMRDGMSMMMGTNMDMTKEPMMEMTDEIGMDMTKEPMMEMTDEMGMPMMGVSCLFAVLSGAAEVPGPGDDDAWGVALFSIDAASGTVCYDIAVANITLPSTANHIHEGEAGVSGPPVVTLPTTPDTDGKAWGCMTADAAEAQEIVDNPAGYYYNVHTSDFPDGAVRGQLMNWSMMDMSMMDRTSMDMIQMMQMVEMMSMGNMGSDMMEMTPEATPAS